MNVLQDLRRLANLIVPGATESIVNLVEGRLKFSCLVCDEDDQLGKGECEGEEVRGAGGGSAEDSHSPQHRVVQRHLLDWPQEEPAGHCDELLWKRRPIPRSQGEEGQRKAHRERGHGVVHTNNSRSPGIWRHCNNQSKSGSQKMSFFNRKRHLNMFFYQKILFFNRKISVFMWFIFLVFRTICM